MQLINNINIQEKVQEINFPIDLVYTWVDSSDEEWLRKKSQFDNQIAIQNKDAIDKCRFINNDELKYSLRSVEIYAPWINKIYIVTDHQVPKWLNLKNNKIQIIDHSEIIPNDKLPTYNACTIENAIPYIKNLSEHFIYANDDMMFWNDTTPEFFFDGDKPIVRVGDRIKKFKKYKHLYGAMVYKAYKLAKERLHKNYPYFSHHNIDGYKKSLCLECIKEFQEEFNNTISNRFRDFSDVQRSIISYYSLAKGEAILKKNNLSMIEKLFRKTPDSQYFNIKSKVLNQILKSKTHLICVNDCRKSCDKDRENLKQILIQKFPNKSKFEV